MKRTFPGTILPLLTAFGAVSVAAAADLKPEQRALFDIYEELVEITPKSIRLRKRWLDPNERKKQERKKESEREAVA